MQLLRTYSTYILSIPTLAQLDNPKAQRHDYVRKATEISFDPFDTSIPLKTQKRDGDIVKEGLFDMAVRRGLATTREHGVALVHADLANFIRDQLEEMHCAQGTDYNIDSEALVARESDIAAPRIPSCKRVPNKRKQRFDIHCNIDEKPLCEPQNRKVPVKLKAALKKFPKEGLASVTIDRFGNGEEEFVKCTHCSTIIYSDMSKLVRHIATKSHKARVIQFEHVQVKQVSLKKIIEKKLDLENLSGSRKSGKSVSATLFQTKTMKACLVDGVSATSVFSGELGMLLEEGHREKLIQESHVAR